MSDEIKQSNPLSTVIGTVEEVVQDTKKQLEDVSRELEEAAEIGELETFLASQETLKK